MPALIHTITLEYPRSLWQLRQENPNVSFPAEPTDEDLAPFDHAYVHPTPPPECDPRTERVEDTLQPQQADDGTWHQAWTVRPATAEEIAAWDAANQPAPDWSSFKSAMLSSATVNAALVAAMPSAPSAVMALPAALMALSTGGDSADFRACWLMLRRLDLVSQDVLDEVTAAATACHLPLELIGSLGGAS